MMRCFPRTKFIKARLAARPPASNVVEIEMCGKFTAMASWSQVVAFSQPLTADRDYKAEADRELTFRVMSKIPLITLDQSTGKRTVVPMRWGFPHPNDWRRPQPIHARSESIETTKAFARPFLDGQRGIALVKTFNEAPILKAPPSNTSSRPATSRPSASPLCGKRFISTACRQNSSRPACARCRRTR